MEQQSIHAMYDILIISFSFGIAVMMSWLRWLPSRTEESVLFLKSRPIVREQNFERILTGLIVTPYVS